jgi:hypothetical protein
MMPCGSVSAPLFIVKAEFLAWCRKCTCYRGCHLCAVLCGFLKSGQSGWKASAAQAQRRLSMLSVIGPRFRLSTTSSIVRIAVLAAYWSAFLSPFEVFRRGFPETVQDLYVPVKLLRDACAAPEDSQGPVILGALPEHSVSPHSALPKHRLDRCLTSVQLVLEPCTQRAFKTLGRGFHGPLRQPLRNGFTSEKLRAVTGSLVENTGRSQRANGIERDLSVTDRGQAGAYRIPTALVMRDRCEPLCTYPRIETIVPGARAKPGQLNGA